MGPSVLITGGSRGIGAALVRTFYAAGYQVAFCWRSSREAAEALAAELPGVLSIQADVSDSAQVERMMSEVLSAFGR
ncbi:MAG: SDR family NAD(P)-dependent oxidoreductase, partial [Clostridia bacterium]|nr:SDR family NAD(P)-dependent oxidoreductase [Clostridia bacterium]